jgi:Calpain family cysteine protease
MPFIEKAFAKLVGNYENLGGGWQAESWRILNGAPTRFYTMSSINNDPNQAWSVISNALYNGFLVGVDTSSSPPYGLVGGHAYSIIGYYQLKDVYGNFVQNLLRIRNPWG